MQILWLSHVVPYPPRGGVLQRSYHLLKELAGRYELHLWAIVQPAWLEVTHGDVKAGLAEAREALSEFCAGVHFQRLDILENPSALARARAFSRRGGYTANWLSDDAARMQLSRIVSGKSFDAVHVDTISLDPYRAVLPDAPAALTHHNIESHMMTRRAQREANPAKRIAFGIEARRIAELERKTAASYQVHLVCSSLDAARLRETCGSVCTTVVPNPVDVEYFNPGPTAGAEGDEVSLVFAGNMSWYPNRDAMLHFARDIWPRLRERSPRLEMNVVGAHAPEKLRRLSQRDSRFRVLGYVDDVRVPIRQATVYVCPIRDGGGTKLKILDALAMGKAIVAYPVACEGIDVEDDVNVALARDADAFADRIVQLLTENEARRRIEANARRLAEDKYSSARVGKRLAEVYEDLAGGRSSPVDFSRTTGMAGS